MYNPIALNGKLVLVTGASSGIGRAAAVTLHRLGAEVILSGRREQALGETENLLADGASGCSIEPFDLTDVDQIPDWLRRVRERRGRPLNGLVHCAGVGRYAPIATLTRKKIEEMCIPNLYSSVGIIRGFGQKGIAAEGASVVLVSSVASLTASPGMLAYSASKAGVNVLARTAAVELKHKRIRVNSVAAGWVATPMLDRAREALPATFEDTEKRQFLGIIEPEEVALAAAFLLSDASRKITGTVLVLDGGYTC